MGIRRDKQRESQYLNNSIYQMYYNMLTEIAISMFEWKNLPDTCDERFLELSLFREGQAIFFKDSIKGYLNARATANGMLDFYDIPTRRRAFSANGYNCNLSNKDSVLIYNNRLRTNSGNAIEMFARKLMNVSRATDINLNSQKTPIIILANENQRLSLKNLLMQYDGNEPFIYGNDRLDLSGVSVLDLKCVFKGLEFSKLKQEIWSDAMTYLGIDTMTDKRERLVEVEADASRASTTANRFSRLSMRQKACDEINKMFGLNIKVEYRFNTQKYDDISDVESEESEVVKNGNLHDATKVDN